MSGGGARRGSPVGELQNGKGHMREEAEEKKEKKEEKRRKKEEREGKYGLHGGWDTCMGATCMTKERERERGGTKVIICSRVRIQWSRFKPKIDLRVHENPN